MAVLLWDIKFYGTENGAIESDGIPVGGGISYSKKPCFQKFDDGANVQVVSDNSGDVTQTITYRGVSSTGSIIEEVLNLNGLTPVPATITTAWRCFLKAIKSGITSGNIAVEQVTSVRSNTCSATGDENMIYLDAGASNTDNDPAYVGSIIRIVSGTGAGQFRTILEYDGGNHAAYVQDLVTVTDNTSVFKISRGAIMEKSPHEIMILHTVCPMALAERSPNGVDRYYYDKVFISNDNATDTLASAILSEYLDESGRVTIGAEDAYGGTSQIASRLEAPSGIVFGNNSIDFPNSGNFEAGDTLGIWLRFYVPVNTGRAVSSYSLAISGVSA